MDFLPKDARPHERAILIVYHVLGVTDAQSIKDILGYRGKTTIHRTLAKYRGKIDVSVFGADRHLRTSVTVFHRVP